MIPAGLTDDELREPARHALWRAGDLTYLLHEGREPTDPIVQRYVPPQLRGTGPRGQIHALEALEAARARAAALFVVLTGRQYGKSLFFVVWAAMLCVRAAIEGTEMVRIPYAAPSGKQVEQFITPHFLMLQEHAPPDLRPTHDKQAGEWIFPRGDRIVVAGCEDVNKADRLRGPRAHAAIVDEGGFIPILDYVIESVLGWQLATTGGILLCSSTPPTSLDHPFVALTERAEEEGLLHRATTPEAPHMTAELLDKAIARCGGEHTVAWQREGLARLIVDPAATVLPEFGASETVIGEHVRPQHFFPAVIGDGGFIDHAVYAFGYYDFEAALWIVEDELVFRRSRSDDMGAKIEEKAAELWPKLEVERRRVDASPQVRADMNRADWGDEQEARAELPEGKEPPHWLSVTKPRGLPGQGSMERGVNHVRIMVSQGRIKVHPRCKTIIAHSTNARWNLARDSFVRVLDSKREPIHHYDGCAALVYAIRDMSQENPYPASAPTSRIDAWRRERAERTDEQRLRSIFRRTR